MHLSVGQINHCLVGTKLYRIIQELRKNERNIF